MPKEKSLGFVDRRFAAWKFRTKLSFIISSIVVVLSLFIGIISREFTHQTTVIRSLYQQTTSANWLSQANAQKSDFVRDLWALSFEYKKGDPSSVASQLKDVKSVLSEFDATLKRNQDESEMAKWDESRDSERVAFDKLLSLWNETRPGAESLLEKIGKAELDSTQLSEAIIQLSDKFLSLNDSIQEVIEALRINGSKQDIRANEIKTRLYWLFGTLFLLGIPLFATSLALTRNVSNTLARINGDLGLAAKQVEEATSKLFTAARELAEKATGQAASIEETASSLEEMSALVTTNVSSATRAVDLSEKMARSSEDGNDAMEKMHSSMREILASNEKIALFVKMISAIDKKTEIMDEIVFQTKLLSFNASVEAERAGEHGRGFSVVAQEVGNLAQMSGVAAKEISQILASSVSQAETMTTENRKKVEQGAQIVSSATLKLKEILSTIHTISEGANQVLTGSREQINGIKQINAAMGTIDAATQASVSLAEEVAGTAKALTAEAENLNAAVAHLNTLINGSAKTS
jgi:methyl-accepting chemotaxis protein